MIMKNIQILLKKLDFERSLHSDGTHSYYKFHDKRMIQFYYRKDLGKWVLDIQGNNYPSVRAEDDMILDVLKSIFQDKMDVIREWKLNQLGI
jgi:hypothetical protein